MKAQDPEEQEDDYTPRNRRDHNRDDQNRDDDDYEEKGYGEDDGMGKSLKRSARRQERTVQKIHKSLVSGPNGGRVADVVEASQELAQMVNVFGRFLAEISEDVNQVRRDQREATALLADAVNTVVKSQAAMAFGLERMAKSTASLAKSGGSLQKSAATRPAPGVVMNGKVLAEGNALRRSNAFVDETGSAVVADTHIEQKLTKSLLGTVIQEAVIAGEFTPTDALRWLSETDSPVSGPVTVYRQLPAKLQRRIADKVGE
jgi:hypothetical protein